MGDMITGITDDRIRRQLCSTYNDGRKLTVCPHAPTTALTDRRFAAAIESILKRLQQPLPSQHWHLPLQRSNDQPRCRHRNTGFVNCYQPINHWLQGVSLHHPSPSPLCPRSPSVPCNPRCHFSHFFALTHSGFSFEKALTKTRNSKAFAPWESES